MRFSNVGRLLAALLPLTSISLAQWLPGPQSKRVRFSGYEWFIKDSADHRVGPGGNRFSEDAVRVDDKGLTLRVLEKDGRYYCAEVVSVPALGYGTYRFRVAANVNGLASNVVLGMFTWSDDPGAEGTHKELDVELGRWGDPEADIAQFVVQPYTRPVNIVRFALPPDANESVHSFTWTPSAVRFTSEVRGAIVQEHAFTRRIPAADEDKARVQARINLWITGSSGPGDGAVEVTIKSFEFLPYRDSR